MADLNEELRLRDITLGDRVPVPLGVDVDVDVDVRDADMPAHRSVVATHSDAVPAEDPTGSLGNRMWLSKHTADG